MRAHDSFLSKLLQMNDAVFSIPVYQRNYDWGLENCEQLFNDIDAIANSGKEHFIGSIVYISVGTATDQSYNIIDGQQRITSVMLFLRALCDITDNEKLKKLIRNKYLINLDLDDTPKVKLKQVESDSGVYEKLIMSTDFDEKFFSENEKKSNVYKNYILFRDLISQTSTPHDRLYNSISLLEIIDVCLTTEDPQGVFESMNSTGKNLTNTDLLRNYLLMDLPHNIQEKFYKNYWRKIEENIGHHDMEQFMSHYLIMKRKTDSIQVRKKREKINKNNLYNSYKQYYSQAMKNIDETEKLLQDITKYSVFYSRITNSSPVTILDKLFYEIVYELNSDSPIIFLMYLMGEGISGKDLEDATKAIISYVFRLRIFKSSASNQFFSLAIQNYEKNESDNFMEKIWTALTSGQGSFRFPKDREFKDTFENKNMYLEFKPQMLRYILYKYERNLTKEVVETDAATIEHIMPQDTSKWKDYLDKKHDVEYGEQLHKIGNLTLTKYNSEMSNDSFDDKKKLYKDSGYAITRALTAEKDWTSYEIKLRSKNMAEKALELWPLPEEYNKSELSNNHYDVMNDKTEELFDEFMDIVKDYYPSLYVAPKKLYINFKKNSFVVFSVVPLQDNLNILLNTTIDNLEHPEFFEDVSEVGHWGVGKTRIKIHNEEEMWRAIEGIESVLGKRE